MTSLLVFYGVMATARPELAAVVPPARRMVPNNPRSWGGHEPHGTDRQPEYIAAESARRADIVPAPLLGLLVSLSVSSALWLAVIKLFGLIF